MKELLDKLFKDNKKRHLWTFVVIIPLLIVVGVCGYGIYKEAKELIGKVGGDESQNVSDEYLINDGVYVLRDNATEIQKECFNELKHLIEERTDETKNEDIVSSLVKNFVVDFYTWSNKNGQYDVGGLYYLYQPQKEVIYIQARDQFYKYINQYINKYGVENLLEVENVETTVDGSAFDFEITDEIETNEWAAYNVVANWTYKQKDGGFDISKYDTKGYFVVANCADRWSIVYAGSKPYEKVEATDEVEE